ncbi:MAG TPA: amino-acid N-acetyltransferase [Opitutales bacterium]|nr:amino-acid N-acetyltransferase [Opitutales bacterium]
MSDGDTLPPAAPGPLPEDPNALKPADLRGILRYVPQFRDHVFVLAIDGSIVDDENLPNVLTDIAVLRSLHIRVVLVHGIGRQLKRLASQRNVLVSDVYGGGPTDAPTLKLAIETSSQVSHQIIEGLTHAGMKCALTNAVRAAPVGIVKGKDQLFSGKVDKIDVDLIRELINLEIVPVISPIGFDREGHSLRINSDHLASELAIRLAASKLIFLTPHAGLLLGGQVEANIPLEQLEALLQKHADQIDERLRSKSYYAVRALEGGTPRAHILDGRVLGGLLTEIFDKVGVGTMIHANEYQQIRPARKKDAQSIYNITRAAVKTEKLRQRTREQIEREIDDYYVYEIDGSVIGCVSLQPFEGTDTAELASVFVTPFYQGRGVGHKLAEFACLEAQRRGFTRVIALSTQSYSFFREVCGFEDGTVDDLPAARREDYMKNGRNSRILIKRLAVPLAKEP